MRRWKFFVVLMVLVVFSWGISGMYAAPDSAAAQVTNAAGDSPAVIQSGGTQMTAADAAAQAIAKRAAALKMKRDTQQFVRDALDAQQPQTETPAAVPGATGKEGAK